MGLVKLRAGATLFFLLNQQITPSNLNININLKI